MLDANEKLHPRGQQGKRKGKRSSASSAEQKGVMHIRPSIRVRTYDTTSTYTHFWVDWGVFQCAVPYSLFTLCNGTCCAVLQPQPVENKVLSFL